MIFRSPIYNYHESYKGNRLGEMYGLLQEYRPVFTNNKLEIDLGDLLNL